MSRSLLSALLFAASTHALTYRVRLRTPLGIAFEECMPGQAAGVVVADLVAGGNAERDGRVLVGDRLIRCSAVTLGGNSALLSVGGDQYTSWERKLVPCSRLSFDGEAPIYHSTVHCPRDEFTRARGVSAIMAALGSNSGRYGYTDAVLELQHTAESVPRPALAGGSYARLDAAGGDVNWDASGGTSVNGRNTPIRPRPDDF